MSDSFYRAFEDKFRGSRELIKSRQRVYLPFIEPLLSCYENAEGIDLGCGRGEWLEILKESGFNGYGVDLDQAMLAACLERGLNVAVQDALSALKALPDESLAVVSGFHIAEHIPFSDLCILIQEALRVLEPAGLLILETPNPENLTVGIVDFYIDPTHQKPIPPQLLSFLPEYYGFAKVKVIRLQEDKLLASKAWTSLRDVLSGVSPDYAVVAQKNADPQLLDCNSHAFAKDYGLTLDVLAGKFDQQAQQASERAESAQAQAQQASERAESAQAQAQQASERATNAEAALVELHRSRSWRLTAPLRMAGRAIRSLFQKMKSLNPGVKTRAKVLLAHASLYVNRRPRFRRVALLVLARFPAAKARLRAAAMPGSVASAVEPAASTDLAHLTPHARQIYTALKNKMDHREKERN